MKSLKLWLTPTSLFSTLLIGLALSFALQAEAQEKEKPFQLIQKWKITGLSNPESVVYDEKRNVLYVSNVNGAPTDEDHNGYIAKVSVDGKITTQKWITGLNAPKGLALYRDKLYVADINRIVEIDVVKSKIVATYAVAGATFLNDLVVDARGDVFASNTFGFSGIFKLSKGKVETWIKDEQLNLPNGLYIEEGFLYAGTWGANPDPKTYATAVPGKLIKINLSNKNDVQDVTSPIGNLDGLEASIHGFLITDWIAGKVLYYAKKDQSVVDVLSLAPGTADIHFSKKTKVLYIPSMLDNSLYAYSLTK